MSRLVFLSLTVLLATGVCSAKVNFSGVWQINLPKSDYGRLPPPQTLIRTVKHNDPNISVSTKQTRQGKETTASFTYTTDGKETVSKTPTGDVRIVAKWEGESLVVESTRDVQGNELKEINRWTASEDGKSMTVVVSLKSPQGETRMILFLDKQ
ncbi:MAG: hypothetical protein HY820_31985 [Acidobacteria bacterium]|nr:hypothetical protein [Acidobacteriota bacterium]